MTERNFTTPGNFFSNYAPIPVEKIREQVNQTLEFEAYTDILQELLAEAAKAAAETAAVAALAEGATEAEIAAAKAVTSSQTEVNLETLRQVATTPGKDKWGVRAANAAVRAAETAAFGSTLENTYKDIKYKKS